MEGQEAPEMGFPSERRRDASRLLDVLQLGERGERVVSPTLSLAARARS